MKTNKPRKPHALARHICALASACLIAASLAPAAAFASEATSRLYDSLYIPEGLDIGSMAPPNSGAATPAYTELPDDSTLFSGAPLPEKFDLRNSDGANFVTPVRSQNPWGTCWSFGAVAALESNLLMQAGGATGSDALATFDLSERFLSYFRYAPASDEALSAFGAASQTGEGLKVVDESSLFDAGGNLFDAVSFTMSAGGLPGEAAAPYRNASGETISWEDPVAGTISCYAPDGTWSLPETVLTDRNNRTADFDSCMMLPTPWNLVYLDDGSMVAGEFDPQAIDVAKRAIMENGAIAAGYYADVAIPEDQTQETEFFSVKNWCQYVNRPTAGNHVVTIVGWDDTYPKGNFPTEPEGDGAWIVKNSWGSKDGDAGSLSHWGIDGTGYFYLSYYDMSVASLYSVTAADADPDTIIQQHDWVGVTESFLVSPMSTTEASAANVFTAEQDMLIESVTAFADASETNARIAIYLLGDEAETPDDGVLVAEQTTLLPFRGLYTVDLDEPVPVRAGQRYAVVQTLTATMEDPQTGEQIPVWCLPIERGVSQDYSASIGYSLYMDVVVNEGESLCFADGGWFDASEFNDDPNMTEDGMVTYGNFAIKVFGTPTQLQDVGSLSIVHTNDIHGRYATAGADAAVNGFAAVAALAQDCGADLILDAGDTFHGSTFSTVNQGEAVAALMDAAGYDATTPGNHDWSYGSARLAQIDRDHDFAVLAANVQDENTGSPLFENEYLLREVALENENGDLTGESVTVGVFGVIDEDFYGSTAPDNVEGVAFANSVEAANDTAAELRKKGADVVIALTHNEDPQAFAEATSGIDAVIAGHEHVNTNETVTGADGRTVVVAEQASSPTADYFGSIGLLSLEMAESEQGDFVVAEHDAQSFATADIARPHEAIDGLTAQLESENAALLEEVVGRSGRAYEYAASSTTAPGGWELVRTQDEPIGHVVTGAYLARTGADLAFENAGGIRGGIPAGDVTMGDILAVSPYDNALAIYELTGSQIADTIERSLALSADCRDVLAKQMEAAQAGEDPMQYSWPESSGSVLQVGGAVMEVDWSKPDGQRIRSITVDGTPLDPDRTYSVAMNSYVASATGLYPALEGTRLLGEYGTCTEALIGLIGQADWEATAARLSGTVAYATNGSSGSQGEGSADENAGATAGNSSDTGKIHQRGNTGSNGASRFAATGDATSNIIATASLSTLLALTACAYALCMRRQHRRQ